SRSGKHDEALADLEKTVALARAVVKTTPEAGRNQWLLASHLRNLAMAYRRKRRLADARAAYDECNQIMDALVLRLPDWSNFAAQWISYRNDTADFLRDSSSAGDQIQAVQNRLRTLDEAIQRGRTFGARFPRNAFLHQELA